ncbi:MAG: lytic polysaccharide monooxygenase [Streptosporangiaceae bacterium]
MGCGHRLVGAAVGGGLLVLSSALPAQAHGALANPPSRAVVCGPEGGRTARSAVCRAAAAAGERGAPARWDDIRVAGVEGRDREKIPDGRLCSGGLASFAGLDLPRADWPATRLRSGSRISFRYRVMIPHRGSFRLYLTRDGFDPAGRLRWSDLAARPFLTVADPVAANGFYTLNGRVPAGRSGRHLIYTVWQTSDTPDTYYSCADVDLGTRSTVQAAPRPTGTPAIRKKRRAAAAEPGKDPQLSGQAGPVVPNTDVPNTGVQNTPDSGSPELLYLTVLGGGVAVVGATVGLGRRFRR